MAGSKENLLQLLLGDADLLAAIFEQSIEAFSHLSYDLLQRWAH